MAVVGSFREQHIDMGRLAESITSLLRVDQLKQSCTAVRLNLSAYMRKVRVHLALEERFICERLLRHSDPAIVTRVTQHQQEMWTLGERVATYADRWNSEVEIQKAPQQFVEETYGILELATRRFELEDHDLYPLVEQLLNPSGSWPLDLMAETDRIRSAG
jgi:hemerythrin-like domain-containing protein